MKRFFKLAFPVLLLVTVLTPVMAVEELESSGPITKLGRGVANIAFGPLELLKQPYDINQNMGAIPALTYGVLRGVCYTIAREVVGVTDIITFPMPLPGCTDDPEDYGWGYGPMMRPPWVFDIEHNPYNFFYDDTAIAE